MAGFIRAIITTVLKKRAARTPHKKDICIIFEVYFLYLCQYGMLISRIIKLIVSQRSESVTGRHFCMFEDLFESTKCVSFAH